MKRMLSKVKMQKKSILSYFEAHYEQYSYFASFDEGLNGVLAYDANDFRIAFLYVKKQDRRKDIGSSLLDALKEKSITNEYWQNYSTCI